MIHPLGAKQLFTPENTMHTSFNPRLTEQEAIRMVGSDCVEELANSTWEPTGRVLPGQDGMDCNDDDYVSEYRRMVTCVPAEADENCCTLAEFVFATTAQYLAEAEWPETTGFEIY
jgi:hypothetical protein